MVESASSPVYAVCLRHIALTQAWMVRMHGPFRARCPGSGRPPGSRPVQSGPAISTTSTAAAESIVEYTPQTPLPSKSDTPVPVPVQPVRPSVKLIRLPKGSRELGGTSTSSFSCLFTEEANDLLFPALRGALGQREPKEEDVSRMRGRWQSQPTQECRPAFSSPTRFGGDES